MVMTRVGLLEDNDHIARFCSVMLGLVGYEVVIYPHARSCLDALWNPTESRLPIEALILDLHLPDMDGLEVVQSLLAHPLTSNLPLLVCTAADQSERRLVQRIAPGIPIISKPFSPPILTAAVQNMLRSHVNEISDR